MWALGWSSNDSINAEITKCHTAQIRCSIRHVRNECDLPGALERDLQFALVHRAGAGNPPRQDLAALGNERSQQLHVLVVDVVDLVRAELADLAPAEHGTALAVLLVARFL